MKNDQFEREKNYQISRSIMKSMLKKGIIEEADFVKIDTILKSKYRPLIWCFISFETP